MSLPLISLLPISSSLSSLLSLFFDTLFSFQGAKKCAFELYDFIMQTLCHVLLTLMVGLGGLEPPTSR